MPLACILLASFAVIGAVSARLSCKVPHLGGGQDDGPAINKAFQRCAKNGKVVLDEYYLVDSLLFTTELDDVEIELSGTRKCWPYIFTGEILTPLISSIHSRYC